MSDQYGDDELRSPGDQGEAADASVLADADELLPAAIPALAGRVEVVHGTLSTLGMRIDALVSATNSSRATISDRLGEYSELVTRLSRSQAAELDEYRRANERSLAELRKALSSSDDALQRVAARIDEMAADAGTTDDHSRKLIAEVRSIIDAQESLGRFMTDALDQFGERVLERMAASQNDLIAGLESIRTAMVTNQEATNELAEKITAPQLRQTVDELRADVQGLRRAVLEWPELTQTKDQVLAIRVEMGDVLERLNGVVGPSDLEPLRADLREVMALVAPGQGDELEPLRLAITGLQERLTDDVAAQQLAPLQIALNTMTNRFDELATGSQLSELRVDVVAALEALDEVAVHGRQEELRVLLAELRRDLDDGLAIIGSRLADDTASRLETRGAVESVAGRIETLVAAGETTESSIRSALDGLATRLDLLASDQSVRDAVQALGGEVEQLRQVLTDQSVVDAVQIVAGRIDHLANQLSEATDDATVRDGVDAVARRLTALADQLESRDDQAPLRVMFDALNERLDSLAAELDHADEVAASGWAEVAAVRSAVRSLSEAQPDLEPVLEAVSSVGDRISAFEGRLDETLAERMIDVASGEVVASLWDEFHAFREAMMAQLDRDVVGATAVSDRVADELTALRAALEALLGPVAAEPTFAPPPPPAHDWVFEGDEAADLEAYPPPAGLDAYDEALGEGEFAVPPPPPPPVADRRLATGAELRTIEAELASLRRATDTDIRSVLDELTALRAGVDELARAAEAPASDADTEAEADAARLTGAVAELTAEVRRLLDQAEVAGEALADDDPLNRLLADLGGLREELARGLAVEPSEAMLASVNGVSSTVDTLADEVAALKAAVVDLLERVEVTDEDDYGASEPPPPPPPPLASAGEDIPPPPAGVVAPVFDHDRVAELADQVASLRDLLRVELDGIREVVGSGAGPLTAGLDADSLDLLVGEIRQAGGSTDAILGEVRQAGESTEALLDEIRQAGQSTATILGELRQEMAVLRRRLSVRAGSEGFTAEQLEQLADAVAERLADTAPPLPPPPPAPAPPPIPVLVDPAIESLRVTDEPPAEASVEPAPAPADEAADEPSAPPQPVPAPKPTRAKTASPKAAGTPVKAAPARKTATRTAAKRSTSRATKSGAPKPTKSS